MRLLLVFFAFSLCLSISAQKHVFYLHGRIVEIKGANAIETTNGYGAYKYNAIIDSLNAHHLIVHSEVRPATTQVNEYAQKITLQINDLINKGVAASDICIIGASKGASIALKIAELLNNPQVGYVLLAGCCSDEHITLSGRVLSIYESSDFCGSCKTTGTITINEGVLKEIMLSTGLRHGFLYTPLKEWLNPALNWAQTGIIE